MSGILPIPAYPIPEFAELPQNRAGWVADPDRSMLLVHDMQRYFVQPFERPFRDRLVSRCRLLIDICSARDVPVVYTAQPGSMNDRQRGLLKDIWGPGMRADAADRAIVDELAPRTGDKVFTKWRYSAFHRSDLLQTLSDQGRDQLLICGVYAHVGILVTAIDAFSHGIQPFVVADAVGDFSAEDYQMALSYAAGRCAALTHTDRIFL